MSRERTKEKWVRTVDNNTRCHPELEPTISRSKLTFEQTGKVFKILDETNWELTTKNKDLTIHFSVRELLQKMKFSLQKRRVRVLRDGVRIVGSVATNILSNSICSSTYNDLDINVYLDPKVTSDCLYFHILQAEEEALQKIIEEQTGQLLSLKEIFDMFFCRDENDH